LKCDLVSSPVFLMEGVIGVMLQRFSDYAAARTEITRLASWIKEHQSDFEGVMQMVIYDDFEFSPSAENINDYLWLTYTRSNPSHDVYGVDEVLENKHWGCRGPMIIDARKKPHHAPELELDPETEKKIERFFKKDAVLAQWA
jgi:4-hydroxy-3-polyprenylbenzoate decarboxylase